jgi:hypothetical protein
MTRIGEQADVLRALGRYLDEQVASGIEITAHEVFLAVSWQGASTEQGHRAYQEHDLEALRAHARALRQPASTAPRVSDGTLAELLRTLGQQLDEDDVEMHAIHQENDGFRVSGVVAGRYRTGLRFTSELLEMSAERRAARGTGVDTPIQVDPFGLVTVGAPVFTRDNQRLGKVGEVRGRSFRVETGFLKRDFWLPASSIESVSEGEPVLLMLAKAAVDDVKRYEAPVVP